MFYMPIRQRILASAQRIIQTKGVLRATTKEIAREAGCSEGVLYRHFASKEDLFLALVQQHLPPFIEALDSGMSNQESLTARLEHIALAAIRYFEQLLPLAVVFLADRTMLERNRALMREIDGGPQRVYEYVARYIEQEQQQGHLARRQDAMHITLLLLGPCFQHAFARQFMGENPMPLTDEQFVRQLIQTMRDGIV